MSAPDVLLELCDIRVDFARGEATVEAVRGVSLAIAPGECLAVIGESGSGKSQTFLGILGLLAANGRIAGSASFEGRELIGLPERALSAIRGPGIGMIFQDPLSTLAPHIRVGDQIADGLRTHRRYSTAQALDEAREWLDRVQISDPGKRMRQYPHELSGGMRQRVMIAAALAPKPRLLIADEPTTALDVTIQAELLDLIDELVTGQGISLALITHDMGVVARMADRVCVMRRGAVVEQGAAADLLTAPAHAHTRALLDAVSRVDRPRRAPSPPGESPMAVLEAHGVYVRYPLARTLFKRPPMMTAVDDAGFTLRAGETLAIVGESGSGKSSLARAAIGLIPRDAGAIAFLGDTEAIRGARTALAVRRDLQIVFQDPLASLDPMIRVAAAVAEPLDVHRPELSRRERRRLAEAQLELVGLGSEFAGRFPAELSGGQAQRVGIARATILKPQLLVCDEAVSALDMTIRAQVIDLFIRLQSEMGLAILFITHDLAVVREIAHRVLVLRHGRVMELAAADALFATPRHPYTGALMRAALSPDPAQRRVRTPARQTLPDTGGSLQQLAPDHWVRGA